MISGKKILLFTDESTAGGVAQFNHSLLKGLSRAGWDTFGAQPPTDSPLIDEQRKFGVRHLFLSYEPRLDFTRSFSDTVDTERIIGSVQPDIVFFSDCSPISNIAAKHVAIKRGIPYVVMCHSGAAYLAEKFPACLAIVGKQNNFARQVIAISGRSLSILRESFGLLPDKGVVISNGRPEAFFDPPLPGVRQRVREELQVPEDAVLCFTSARFDSGKGHALQLAAIRALSEGGALGPLYFAWAGVGELHARVAADVASAGLGSRVRILGQRWDIDALLDASDLFVLTTLSEGGLPLAAMEAMAKGIATVITSVNGIPEIVGDAARLLPDPVANPRGTVQELARSLLQLSADPALRAELGASGRRMALRDFNLEANLAKTLAVIEAGLDGPAVAAPPAPRVVAKEGASQILVSAIVSTYKSERFILGCMEDLVGQTLFTRGQMEIVVVDSNSPENEGAVVREFQRRHKNIVYIRTDERETLYAAWNRGIGASRGKFISNANTDDRHRPNALELMALALEDEPGMGLVYGDCYLSTIPNEPFVRNSGKRMYLYPEFFAPAALLHYQLGPQPMWRRTVHESIGGFDGTMRAAGDYDFNLRFAQKLSARHLPVALGSYLAHEAAISFADDTMQRETQEIAKRFQNDATIEALYAKAGIRAKTSQEKALIHLDLGMRAVRYLPPWKEGKPEANPALAAKCFLRSLELNPQQPRAFNNLFCLLAWTGGASAALRMLQMFPASTENPVLNANVERVRRADFTADQAGSLALMSSVLDLPGQEQLSASGRMPMALAS
jgi:glycosyltransferase involved in cell wall biosynthesis